MTTDSGINSRFRNICLVYRNTPYDLKLASKARPGEGFASERA